jgi:hypothetical protein
LDRQEIGMTVEQVIEDVESPDFDVRVNLAAGLTLFIQILLQEPAMKTLLSEMRWPDVRSHIESRVHELASVKFDDRYGDPHDAALAAHTWLFSIMAWDEAQPIAETVSHVPNTWWARKVSFLEREPDSARANNSFQIVEAASDSQEPAGEFEPVAPSWVRPDYDFSNLAHVLPAR